MHSCPAPSPPTVTACSASEDLLFGVHEGARPLRKRVTAVSTAVPVVFMPVHLFPLQLYENFKGTAHHKHLCVRVKRDLGKVEERGF